MAEHRFFVDADLRVGASIQLPKDRAAYIGRVLRHRAGDRVNCFCGDGAEFACEITNDEQRSFTLSVVEETRRVPQARLRLHLALSLIKGNAMDHAVQQATELGVTDIWPLAAARNNVRLDAKRLTGKITHWRRIAQSSAEQCGSLFVPVLHELGSLDDVLDGVSAAPIALHPEGEAFPGRLERSPRLLCIGPEGGWDTDELALFEARGVPLYRFGNLTLRAETAPGVALALVQQAQGWD